MQKKNEITLSVFFEKMTLNTKSFNKINFFDREKSERLQKKVQFYENKKKCKSSDNKKINKTSFKPNKKIIINAQKTDAQEEKFIEIMQEKFSRSRKFNKSRFFYI